MKNNIWFVIVAYNPIVKDIRTLLKTLLDYNVLIVDNSPDHSYLRQLKVNKIENARNTGFAGGVNQGIRYCLERNADWIVILNQDISFARRDIHYFTAELSSINTGIVGPIGGKLDSNRWTTILENKESDIDYLTASFIAIHKHVISRIGFFYEEYFMYYEDVDFCIRAKQQKIPLRQISMASLGHDESSSLGKNSLRHNYYLARNHLLFVERLAPFRVKLYELARLPITLYGSYRENNRGEFLGIRDYLLRRFGLFNYIYENWR
jgi:GT2 family glycosyltransferase